MVKVKMKINYKKKNTTITIKTKNAVEYYEMVDVVFDFNIRENDGFFKHIEELFKDKHLTARLTPANNESMALIFVLEDVVDYKLSQLEEFIDANMLSSIINVDYKLKIIPKNA